MTRPLYFGDRCHAADRIGDRVESCEIKGGHRGPHRSHGGHEWAGRPYRVGSKQRTTTQMPEHHVSTSWPGGWAFGCSCGAHACSLEGLDTRCAQADRKAREFRQVSQRTYNCLANANIWTVDQLAARTKGSILRTKNVGPWTLLELEAVLFQCGLAFKGEPPPSPSEQHPILLAIEREQERIAHEREMIEEHEARIVSLRALL